MLFLAMSVCCILATPRSYDAVNPQ